jgi:hypothetical protein
MMPSIRIILFLCVITVFFAVEVLAQSAPMISAPTDIAILKAQLEMTRQFHDSFITMAQWTLSSAIGIAFAIAAFSWYNNKVSYERDRDFLRQEAQALKDQVRITAEQESKQILLNLHEALTEKQAAIQEAVDKSLQSKIAQVNSRIGTISSNLLALEYKIVKQEAEEAFKIKNYNGAHYKYCELLDISVKNGSHHYEASEILDEVKNIQAMSDFRPDADTVNRLVETVKRLPAQHHPFAEFLIDELKNKVALSLGQ